MASITTIACDRCGSTDVVNRFARVEEEGTGSGHFVAQESPIDLCLKCWNRAITEPKTRGPRQPKLPLEAAK